MRTIFETEIESPRDINNLDELFAKAQAFFKDAGYDVTREALEHNYYAWCGDYKSGYKDEANGYFLFSPCRCNALQWDCMDYTGESWQTTYEA